VTPLTRDQFADALAKGHGRALVHVREHGLDGLEDLFLQACLRDQTYDSMCEGDRVPWLGEFFVGAPEWIATPVLTRLREAPLEERWFLCSMALLLAQRGCQEAHASLRAAFYFEEEGAVVALDELLELEGEEGFLWMAAQYGRWAREGRPVDDSLVAAFAASDRWEQTGASYEDGLDKLPELLRASPDPDVRYYVGYLNEQGYEQRRHYRPDGPPSRPDGLTVLKRLRTADEDIFWVGGWGRKAASEDLRLIAGDLFQPLETVLLRNYLRCFMGQGLSEFDSRILAFADHPDREVRRLSHWVLSHHPEARALALQRLEAGEVDNSEVRLLKSAFEPGDETLLQQALAPTAAWEPFPRHTVLRDLLDVLEAHPNEELALFVYEHTPCTNCRGRAVQLLSSPPEECRYDADEEIRARLRPAESDGPIPAAPRRTAPGTPSA